MDRLFGTDGVRGVANDDLTPELAFALGRAGAYVLAKEAQRPKILLCRDTRISGGMLESALAAGITSVGADAVLVGVVPTPACAYLVQALQAQAGIMISASHNPTPDNGIKFFAASGHKLPDEMEDKITELLEWPDLPRPVGEHVGRVYREPKGAEMYGHFLQRQVPVNLTGLQLAVDCANGAASAIAPQLLRQLGATVTELHSSPNGININVDCGSTHMESIIAYVKEHNLDLGIAFDGDADRTLLVDDTGALVDGDHILAICAKYAVENGGLPGNHVAATMYSNGGLRQCLQDMGADLVITQAGDRYVLQAMMEQGLALGGEQSGHVIFLEHNTTGDGILTSLKVMQVMAATGQTLSDLRQIMQVFPQALLNVRVRDKHGWEEDAKIQEAVDQGLAKLAPQGRIFVRASGTEPLIRVMTEHPDEALCSQEAEAVAAVIREQLG